MHCLHAVFSYVPARRSGDQGRELLAAPSNSAFSSCRSLNCHLLQDSLAADALDQQLAVACAAPNMPLMPQDVRILLYEGPAPAARDFTEAPDWIGHLLP